MFKRYLIKFFIRFSVVLSVIYIYRFHPEQLDVHSNILRDGLRYIHLLWIYLFTESVVQLIPRKNVIAGCGKQFLTNYKGSDRDIDKNLFNRNIREMNIQAIKVLFVWISFNLIFSLLYIFDYLGVQEMLILSMLYFLGDVICVVFFCPFQRFIMKNRCCSICRIFSWDHIMMYTPFLFIKSFFTWSLTAMAIMILIRWEYLFLVHPERFQEEYNTALRCRNCQDYICKIRKPIYKK